MTKPNRHERRAEAARQRRIDAAEDAAAPAIILENLLKTWMRDTPYGETPEPPAAA